MNMKGTLSLLMVLLFGYGPAFGQTAEERIAAINGIIDRNHTQHFPWLKPRFSFVSNDLLGMTTLPVRIQPTIPLYYSDILCINTMKSGNLHAVVLYIRFAGDSSIRSSKILFDRPDSLPELIRQFHGLYGAIGKTPPASTCIWYENDLLAQKFEFQHKAHKNNMYAFPVYGVDSIASGYFTVHHVNGTKRLERNLENGLLHGLQKDYHADGTLAFEGNYINGLADGTAYYYNEEGNKTRERKYKDGAEHGVSISFWDSGQINICSTFEMGILVKEEAFNVDGTPQGPPTLFREEIPEK